MTNTRQLRTITLDELLATLQANDLLKAWRTLSSRTGARLTIAGKIEKVIKRDGLKVLLIPEGLADGCTFSLFAKFDRQAERDRFKSLKLRKGKFITLAGELRSFGYQAANLTDCFIC